MSDQPLLEPRESMEFDVVIVGAGPAGLASAIRLKQLANETGQELSVVVLEKGAAVGAHILSGAVIDPSGLNQLIPDWAEKGAPIKTKVTKDKMLLLGPAGSLPFPNFMMPSFMHNHGNYIVSLGSLCEWLGAQAEELGVEVYPGFAASEILYDGDDQVIGVATGDMGIGHDGKPKASFTRGMELLGRYTIFAEGARGSLTKKVIAKYKLDKGREPQKYGIGIKELWEIKPENHKEGLVQHSLGWPLDNSTGGGSFLYHYGENLVSVGFVVHLNYKNPYISPYDEFQRFKTHPEIASTFEGGKRIAYGARALTEGGYQSVPQLSFPGGVLVGCAAGFMNVPRIKGSHNAILSGILAADNLFEALGAGRSHDRVKAYDTAYEKSAIAKELKRVRNVKPYYAKFGTWFGMVFSGLDMWTRGLLPGFLTTRKHGTPDFATLKAADKFKPIAYPKPDGKLTFDKLSSVFLSSTNHEEDQPSHLVLGDPDIPLNRNLKQFAEPAQRYCPAGVYEIVTDDNGKERFQINAQNCVHCKTCDIKDPAQNITWTCPEGGGGPNYPGM